MSYDLLLFDLDDTLFDFPETEKHAFHKTFVKHGIEDSVKQYRESFHSINQELWHELERGNVSLDELKTERFAKLFTLHQLPFNPSDFGHKYLQQLAQEVHLIEGVAELFSNLNDVRLAVVSNGFHEVQVSRVQKSILHNSFEAIITSELAGCQKPNINIFDYAFEQLQVEDLTRVLMIGDSLSSDIQGGNNVGIDTCWFNPKKVRNESSAIPTYEIHHWDEFSSIQRRTFTSV